MNISELQKLLDADSLQKLVEEVADCEGETPEKSQKSHNVAEIDNVDFS